MTRTNEDQRSVNVDRLLDTTLFIAFLHSNNDASGDIARLIAFDQNNEPDAVFYTAQTLIISMTRIIYHKGVNACDIPLPKGCE